MMLDIDRLTLRDLRAVLQPELEAIDDALEYFSLSIETKYTQPARLDQPIGPYRWIACYAVTGGSEGHYVHVDRIWARDAYKGELVHEPLFLAKTFGGYARACQIAALLGERLGA